MSSINRDLDRYLRRRGEASVRGGPNWFDKMFTTAKKEEEDLTSTEMEKLEHVEEDIEEGEKQIEMVHELEEDLEEKQEERVGLYHQLLRFFRQKKAPKEEENFDQYEKEEVDLQVTEDFRMLAHIYLRWLERMPFRVKRQFKDSEDYEDFTDILQRRGVVRKK